MDLFEKLYPNIKTKPRSLDNHTACFVFDYDVDEQMGDLIGIIKDVRLKDFKGNLIPHSSLIQEELGSAGWDAFFDVSDIKVSGRYRWEGTYFATQDYYGEWDCGWDVISFEPADRKTRKALAKYEKENNNE